ncbi:ABC transporter ATP-binding protein [Pararhodospirillum photometricum]|uniref:ABC-type branched-chain amino acid transport systems n=1 Tax=Pararhodospirillum photometricum DSM 122 TaxID=1150469 RepID=H6SKH8_PARPM|nr:ABC transporter ATP-binding protein [Pararhodospirillum photometricum]CCG08493.1 ABC-type branched-chain amino acid transport systems [Pararhodospirillum photometricum DSM 122]
MSLLQVDGLSIHFGGIAAVNAVSFAVEAGEIVSIIGPNGAGKTTLFNMVSGLYRPSAGRVLLDGQEVTGAPPEALARRGLSRTFQNLQVFQQMTVLENVMTGCHLAEGGGTLGGWLADLLHLPASRAVTRASRERSLALLERVGLADLAGRDAGALSYGQLKRLEIARALATTPRLLLLDEPAAGCNAVETQEIDDLILALAGEGLAILLVEHDMKMVMRLSNHIVVLDRGTRIAEGPPETIINHPEVIAAYLGGHGRIEREARYGASA